MRKDWEYKKLKDICSFVGDGDWIESKDQSNAGLRLIQTGNIGNGIFHDKAEKAKYISESTFIELSCTEIFHGDCLLSRLPDPIGRSCILPQLNERAITAVDCTILRFTNKIYPTFFVYYTLSTPYAISIISKTTGSTRKRISRKNLEGILIPIPPKPTQLAIVAELDKINELIQLKKQQLKDYDQLAQSIFYEMFGDPVENEKGWEVKKLGDICEVTSAKRVFIEEVVDSGVPFIRGTELTALNRLTRGEKMEYSLFITKEHYERLKAITGVPKYGDLLIPSINSEGIAWIVNTEEPLYFKDGRVLWVHVNQDVFKSECLQKIMNILLKHTYKSMGGATFSELKLFVLRELKVPIPPIESQQQFAARIEAIERQKQQVSETIKDLETLLASRMQYWFD